MAYLPELNELNVSRGFIDAFGGYNHNMRIGEAEFYDMKNLTSTNYPLLSPRKQRGTYVSMANPLGMIAKDSLCYVDGQYFVMNEYRVDMNLDTTTEKTLISMGAYVIILPDKMWINTKDLTEFGKIEASYTSPAENTVTFEISTVDGTLLRNKKTVKDSAGNEIEVEGVVPHSPTEPSDPTNLMYWIDTSSKPHTLKQYSETSGMWVTIATTYIKISAPNIGMAFEKYDGVTISGVTNEALSDLNNTMVIWDKGDNFITVIGLIDEYTVQNTPIIVERKMPVMDFVTESENRLWGCHYGVAANGEVVNEIYASKLGDFKNWNCFMGISTDSYAASCGTDGQFTAAVTHRGYPLFFKETCVHKVYGNAPSSYQIQTTNLRGVAKGSEKSLATVNEVLFYKSRSAICAYDGSLPSEISSALGDVSYTDAAAGYLGNKYYISMKDDEGQYNLFVYDTQKGMWHREDNTEAKAFCNCRGELYYIDTNGNIKTVNGNGTLDTEPVPWMAETGIIGCSSPDKKYVSRLIIRMALEIGSMVDFFIEYDSMENWEHVGTLSGTTLRTFSVPIKPRRCDHFRLRIEGEGMAKIFSITKHIEEGSDV
jgi:hypothetical protein